MRNSKHGLKALVVGIMVVLGATVLAAGAQAQGHHFELLHLELLHAGSLLTHTDLLLKEIKHNISGGVLNPTPLTDGGTIGKFSVNLGPIVEVHEDEVVLTLKVPLTANQVGTGVLLVAGRSIEIRCTGLTLTTASINNNTDASGEATFTGCETFDHKTLNVLSGCVLKTLGTITAKALVLPILHGNELFVLFEPQPLTHAEELEGKTLSFATPSYKPNMGCTLPLNNPVTGAVVALVEQLEGEALGILFSPGIQLLLGDSLTFGGFPSYITATGTVEPTGSHATAKIGVH